MAKVCKGSACTVGLLVGSMPNCFQFSGRLWVCWHTVRNQNRTLLHPGRSLVASHVKHIYWAGTMFGYDMNVLKFSFSILNVGHAIVSFYSNTEMWISFNNSGVFALCWLMNTKLPRNSYLFAKNLSNISSQLLSQTLIALNNMQRYYVEILYLNCYS